jgi:hypothetical protein
VRWSRWALPAACAALVAADAAFRVWPWDSWVGAKFRLRLGEGGITLQNDSAFNSTSYRDARETIWWPLFKRWGRGGGNWELAAPIWPLTLAVAVVAALPYRPRRRRRGPPNCRECGYSFRGLKYPTPCPECGAPWPFL